MTALLYLDSETTGTTAIVHDIIQIACIPIIDEKEFDNFNQHCQPLNYDTVDQGAVDVHGITIEKMRTFQSSSKMLNNFITYLKSFNCKFTLAGFNCEFDRRFLGAMFQKHGKNKEYRELFTNNVYDVFVRAKSLKQQKIITSASLSSVAEYFKIDLINAHDALADIRATIEIDKKMSEMLGEEKVSTNSYKMPNFDVPQLPALHLHSEYSVYDSATTSEDWLHWADQNSVPAVAFPDHTFATSLFNAINPTKNKDGSLKHKTKTVPAISLWVKHEDITFMLSAWATTETGYRNLTKLSSLGWNTTINLDSKKIAGCVDLQQISEHNIDVVFGTACDSGLISKVLDSFEDLDLAMQYINKVKASCGDMVAELLSIDINKYFSASTGITSYKTPMLSKHQNRSKAINNFIWSNLDIPNIVSSIAHFVDPDDKIVQDCKMKNSFEDQRYHWESRHQRSPKEQFAILKSHISEFSLKDWMSCDATAMAIVDKASSIKIKHNYHMPNIEIPDEIKFKTKDYDKQLYYLLMLKIKEHGRWIDEPIYLERFKKELDVIWKNEAMNFIPYFLIYEEMGAIARANNVLQGLARGSAGGCLISYYLKIIHIDPVKNSLPFERFLSHARIRAGSWPDIDCDYGQRYHILKHLKEKYKLGFAQVGTFQKMKIKSAIKQSMYALYGRARTDLEVTDLCEKIPDSPQGIDEHNFVYGYVDSEDVAHKGVIENVPELQTFFSQYPDCKTLVDKLIGLPASIGRHPSAFVISTLDLSSDRAPTFIAEDDDLGKIQTVQFDGPMCEKSGLVKADILGVSTIQTISDCMARIKINHGIDLMEENEIGLAKIYNLPEDSAVFKDFYDRKTDSSFQFNTDLIKGMIRDFAPTSKKHLSHLTALARPGALDVIVSPGISATKQYMLVRNGQADPIYIHPELEPILKETYGVVAFQEQLMEILVKIAGYSLEESDQIRAAIAKKKREVMTGAFDRIRIATNERGWTVEQSQGLCDIVIAYANYSFNLSHSCAYSALGYVTMFLKHHYPLEWWASELNLSDEDKLRKYMPVVSDIVSPPSLRNPSCEWTIQNGKIYAPLNSIKRIGKKQALNLQKGAPYESFEELLQTTVPSDFHVSTFHNALMARATDCFIDPDLPYHQERRRLVDIFYKIRGKDPRYAGSIKKTKKNKLINTRQNKWKEVLEESDPFKLFLMEKDVSKIFAKSLLDDPHVREWLEIKMPALKSTGRQGIPYTLGSDNPTPIVKSIANMDAITSKMDPNDRNGKKEIYAIMLFQSSTATKGISKKNGKPWKKLEIVLSDGFRTIYCPRWDHDKALGWKQDTPIIVHGLLHQDWKGRSTISINSIEKIDDLPTRSKR